MGSIGLNPMIFPFARLGWDVAVLDGTSVAGVALVLGLMAATAGLFLQARARRRAESLAAERVRQMTAVMRDADGLGWAHFDIPQSQFSNLLFGDRVYSHERGFWENMTLLDQSEMDECSTRAILDGREGYT